MAPLDSIAEPVVRLGRSTPYIGLCFCWGSLWLRWVAAFSAPLLPLTVCTERASTTFSACLLPFSMHAEGSPSAIFALISASTMHAEPTAIAIAASVLALVVHASVDNHNDL